MIFTTNQLKIQLDPDYDWINKPKNWILIIFIINFINNAFNLKLWFISEWLENIKFYNDRNFRKLPFTVFVLIHFWIGNK